METYFIPKLRSNNLKQKKTKKQKNKQAKKATGRYQR